ncbi:hypothetical protein [Streptomyces albidoflavus]|uniref:hypothetical protein n=1 Tax=Streptomyces albidoflavus TaxID=1886 RepID=UPI00308489BB|nr:hypothetical protein OG919_08085 [Streptomyces albidoflavus]
MIRHQDRQDRVVTYDFGRLPGPLGLRRDLAARFAARCAPGGGWESVESSRPLWYLLRTFMLFLSDQDPAPANLAEVSAGHWNAWRLSRTNTVLGNKEISVLGGFLRSDPRLSTATKEAIARRTARVDVAERAYSPQEFDAIRLAARRTFRTALLRIRENTATLQAWRDGHHQPGTDTFLLGELLDSLARTGNIPLQQRKAGSGQSDAWRVPLHHARVLGGSAAQHTWQRLFLTGPEAAALGMLFTTEFGLNATTISELAAPRPTPDSSGNGVVVYRVELVKRRRGHNQEEIRNIADTGAASPGRLITEALEATAHARACRTEAGGKDRLLLWHRTGTIRRGTDPFNEGLRQGLIKDWYTEAGLPGASMRRVRKTVNVVHRREPGQNSQDVHDRVYVLPEPQAHAAAMPVIAEGATDALDAARRTVVQARLSDAAPGTEVVTNSCTDLHSSPFETGGSPCTASFLLCTACPNARVAPHHHPRLTYLHQVLQGLRGTLDPQLWEAEWSEAYARLSDLRHRIGPGVWEDASTAVTEPDRVIIHQLVNGHYDS